MSPKGMLVVDRASFDLVWQVKSVEVHPDWERHGLSKDEWEEGQEILGRFLERDWEPFSVTPVVGYPTQRVWLRRQVERK